jgi:hypothetical protein
MLTDAILFGMNALSLGGFALMAASLTLTRQQKIGTATAFAVMSAGTLLLLLGLYLAPAPPA